jgi:hypothetical protein
MGPGGGGGGPPAAGGTAPDDGRRQRRGRGPAGTTLQQLQLRMVLDLGIKSEQKRLRDRRSSSARSGTATRTARPSSPTRTGSCAATPAGRREARASVSGGAAGRRPPRPCCLQQGPERVRRRLARLVGVRAKSWATSASTKIAAVPPASGVPRITSIFASVFRSAGHRLQLVAAGDPLVIEQIVHRHLRQPGRLDHVLRLLPLQAHQLAKNLPVRSHGRSGPDPTAVLNLGCGKRLHFTTRS